MIRTSLTRRLVAGAAGLMIGATGALALAAPAQATFGDGDGDGDGHGYQGPVSEVMFHDHCDVVTVVIKPVYFNHREWTVTVDGEEYWSGKPDRPYEALGIPSDAELIQVTFENAPEGFEWPREHQVKRPDDCEPDPEPEPEPEPEPAKVTDTLFVGCDLFAFGIRNDGDEDGVSMTLTPNEEVEHGHAPGLIPHIGEESDEFEVPEGFALEGGLDPLAAGEAFGPIGPIAADDDPPAHVHGFVPFEGLVVTVEIEVGDTSVIQDISWEDRLELHGIECEEEEEDGGEGGELPTTGLSTGMIAIGALALLAVGGGLFLVARRRRVTFTA